MKPASCGFPQEWLLALRDGDLRAAQLEVTEAHVRACPECRQWLDELDAIRRLLHESNPYPDNPLARAEIKARVATVQEPVRTFNLSNTRRTLAATLTLLVVLLVAVSPWRDPAIEAGTGLSHFMRSRSTAVPILGSSAQGDSFKLPSATVAAPNLPMGLAETGEIDVSDTFIRRILRAPSGLTVSYAVDCSESSFVVPSTRDGMSEVAGMGGLPISVFYGQEHGQVVALYWLQAETLHEVLILEEAIRPVSIDNAMSLVEALIAEEGNAAVACGG